MDKLARYSGQADGTLDKRQLNNVVAPGFEISVRKIDTDAGDGKYPQVKRVYGDVTSEELNRNAGLTPRSPPYCITGLRRMPPGLRGLRVDLSTPILGGSWLVSE